MVSVFVGRKYERLIMAVPRRRREPSAPPRNECSVPELDELTVARLTGVARRHAPGREPTAAETAAAVQELTDIADGRSDLLAEVAGLLLGYYRRTAEEARAEAAAHYCIAAGADLGLISPWIEVGQRRAAAARQSSGIGHGDGQDDPNGPSDDYSPD